MTKDQTIKEMQNGLYVRHKYFLDSKAVTMDHGLIVDTYWKMLKPSVYAFLLEMEFINGAVKVYSGDVTLLR